MCKAGGGHALEPERGSGGVGLTNGNHGGRGADHLSECVSLNIGVSTLLLASLWVFHATLIS